MSSMDAIRREVAPMVPFPVSMTTVLERKGAPDIRQFDAAAVNAAIDRAVSILKPEERVVAVAYVDKYGANVAVVGKLPVPVGGLTWTVFATVPKASDWNAGAALRWTF